MTNFESKFKELINLVNNNQFDQALTYASDLLKENINNSELHNILGIIHLKKNQDNDAVNYFKKAIKLQKNLIHPYINISLIYRRQKLLDKALKYINYALEIDVNNEIIHINRGNILKDLEQYHDSKESYLNAIKINCNIPEAYNNLGTVLEKLSEFDQAIKNYEKSIKLNNSFVPGYRNLIRLFDDLDNYVLAIKYIEKLLLLQPDDDSLRHKLSALKEENVSLYDQTYARTLHNSKAEKFENHLINNLNYNAPNQLKELFDKSLKEKGVFKNAIDIGCGTGLSGFPFYKKIENFVGIDLSENMLTIAKKKNIYNRLVNGDANSALKNEKKIYDLIISVDTFIYIGNLETIFENIKKISITESFFIFTTEHYYGDKFKLNKSGRYSHSYDYIKKILDINSFKILNFEESNLRKEKGKWINGGFYITKLKLD